MALLVCFGDSISYGYGAAPGEAWVERLGASLAALRPPVHLRNAGVNGETSEDGLRRMARDVEAFAPTALYVQFGLNDCSWWCGQEGRPWISRQAYIDNLREIVRRAFACGTKLVFVATNHPVGRAPYGMHDYQQNVRDYNEALRETFAKTSAKTARQHDKEAVLIDLERGILGDATLNPADLLAPDGVHLSPKGNAWYAKILTEIMTARLQG